MSPRRAALVSICSLALASSACGDKGRSSGDRGKPHGIVPAPPTSSRAEGAPSVPAPSTSVAPAPQPTSPPAPQGTSAAEAAASGSGGAGDCRLLRGPVRLSTIGAVTIGPGTGGLLAFATNKVGAPSWETPTFPDPPKQGTISLLPKQGTTGSPLLPAPGAKTIPSTTSIPSASATVSAPASASASASAAGSAEPDRTRLPACAVAGGFSFCTDAEGSIHRSLLNGEGDKIVAKGRKGTPVAAAAVAGHTYYAFLANQRTTEGVIVRAFAGVDDESPVPLSEDGSGATFLGLVARDTDVLAMYIDARTALTPIHARTLRAASPLSRGNDAVVYIASGSDGRIRGALGRAQSGPAFLFAAGPHDDKDYGVVTITVDGEPKDDLPGKWSHYPTAMNSSALAATEGKTPLRLVRSRPETKESPTPQALELGHVQPDGTFSEKCVVAKANTFSDVEVEVDDRGNLWLAYTNGQGTWVEQRGDGK